MTTLFETLYKRTANGWFQVWETTYRKLSKEPDGPTEVQIRYGRLGGRLTVKTVEHPRWVFALNDTQRAWNAKKSNGDYTLNELGIRKTGNGTVPIYGWKDRHGDMRTGLLDSALNECLPPFVSKRKVVRKPAPEPIKEVEILFKFPRVQ